MLEPTGAGGLERALDDHDQPALDDDQGAAAAPGDDVEELGGGRICAEIQDPAFDLRAAGRAPVNPEGMRLRAGV